MRAKLLLWFLLLPGALLGQGFAGLGTDAEGFALPERRALVFPEDHRPHPEFRIEWWYITANLETEDGMPMGLQWTLFRTAGRPEAGQGWTSPQAWMGHAAVTTPDRHFVSERLARGGIGQAGAKTGPFRAWIDDWAFAGDDAWQEMRLTASGVDFAYDVTLRSAGPLVAHGANGYSVKSEDGQASHYYSQPRFDLVGSVTLPDGPVAVTGRAWLDREWSSQPLSDTQSGWDWFSLSFDNGAQLMAFGLREGKARGYTSGTWITPDGRAEPFGTGALELVALEPHRVAGRHVPVVWQLALPDRALKVRVEALNRSAWMATLFPYWEGPVVVSGTHPGRGYLEMTGYGAGG